jgi:hypothetical protein
MVAPRRQPEGGDKAVEEPAVANGAEHGHRRRAGASTRADRGEGGRRGGRGRGNVLAPEGAEEGWPAGNSPGSVAWRSSAKIRHVGRPCSSPPPCTKKVELWSQRSSSSFAVFKAAQRRRRPPPHRRGSEARSRKWGGSEAQCRRWGRGGPACGGSRALLRAPPKAVVDDLVASAGPAPPPQRRIRPPPDFAPPKARLVLDVAGDRAGLRVAVLASPERGADGELV